MVCSASQSDSRPRRLAVVAASLKGLVKFAAQPSNGNFHHVRFAVEVHVPDLLGQFSTRQHLGLTTQQQAQQIELLGGQIESLARTGDLAADQVKLQIG